jgi:hypothetical protein
MTPPMEADTIAPAPAMVPARPATPDARPPAASTIPRSSSARMAEMSLSVPEAMPRIAVAYPTTCDAVLNCRTTSESSWPASVASTSP